MNETIKKAIEAIKADRPSNRSKWGRGVTQYAVELLEELAEHIEGGYFTADDLNAPKLLEKQFLNGAYDWEEYSWGGCSLIYNCDICERLATPSEQKRTRDGERRPNAREEWLDTQARALRQASNRAKRAIAKQLAR